METTVSFFWFVTPVEEKEKAGGDGNNDTHKKENPTTEVASPCTNVSGGTNIFDDIPAPAEFAAAATVARAEDSSVHSSVMAMVAAVMAVIEMEVKLEDGNDVDNDDTQ